MTRFSMRTLAVFTGVANAVMAVKLCSAIDTKKHTFEAEAATRISEPSPVADRSASGGSLIGLSKPGQGVQFTRLPAGSKLAIRYASVEVGTISVAVNDQPARKVN